jgi:hypothetical protein
MDVIRQTRLDLSVCPARDEAIELPELSLPGID